MKKNLVILSLLIVTILTANGQKPLSSEMPVIGLTNEDGIEWMQYCYPESNAAAAGVLKDLKMDVFSLFAKDYLEAYKGKKIQLEAVYVCSELNDAVVNIKKGDDPKILETISNKTTNTLFPGWNYVKLDTPVTIDGTTGLSVGYMLEDNGLLPIAFDGTTAVANTSFLSFDNGECFDYGTYWGNLMVRAMVGGDIMQLGNKLSVISAKSRSWIYKNEPLDVTLRFGNNTFTPVESATLSYSINGVEQISEITFSKPIPANSAMEYTVTINGLTENSKLAFNITKVNGIKITSTVAPTIKAVEVYDKDLSFDRVILIEEFTGQACGNCPKGAKVIDESTEGREERVARINHHSGYQKDIFTIEESDEIASFFEVNSAPSCMLNRAIQDERAELIGAEGVVWHPGLMTTGIVDNEINRPSLITVEINTSFNDDTKVLTVNVSGKTNVNLTDVRMSVVLTQSQYVAYQASASTKYLHDDFPIAFLTLYDGEAIIFESDGTYNQSYTYTVKENYNKVVTNLAQLKVVAFVSNWKSKEASNVLNAATKKVETAYTSISDVNDSKLSIRVDGNRILTNMSDAEVNVCTPEGVKVDNYNLSPGIYIVKAQKGNARVVRKVVVR